MYQFSSYRAMLSIPGSWPSSSNTRPTIFVAPTLPIPFSTSMARTRCVFASLKAFQRPRIFVVPHAPDDPGPDATAETEVPTKGARPPYRAVP